MLVSAQLHPYYNAGTHTDVEIPGFTFQIGEWYQYAMTIQRGRASIFVNGEKIYESATGYRRYFPTFRTVSSSGPVSGLAPWTRPTI